MCSTSAKNAKEIILPGVFTCGGGTVFLYTECVHTDGDVIWSKLDMSKIDYCHVLAENL